MYAAVVLQCWREGEGRWEERLGGGEGGKGQDQGYILDAAVSVHS